MSVPSEPSRCAELDYSIDLVQKFDHLSVLISFEECVRATGYMTSELLQVCECEAAHTDRKSICK